MKILGVITARGSSQSLANKNILPLLGQPVINYTVTQARESKFINRLVCSSDSPKILKLAQRLGVEPIRRPKIFARATSPIEEALRHTLVYLREKEGYRPNALVLLYANVPFRKSGLIDSAIRRFIRKKADAVVSVSPIERFHPERLVKVDKKGLFIPYTKRFSTYRRQELSRIYFIDSGVIVMKPELLFLKNQLIISHYFKGHRVLALASSDLGAWDIDNSFDLEVAKVIIGSKSRSRIFV